MTMDPTVPLPTRRLPAGTVLAQARDWPTQPVTLDAPALEVMTDLTRVKAATVTPMTSLAQAEQVMITLGVRMLFVVSDMPAIVGLVSLADLHGDASMRAIEQRNARREELCVADVMAGASMLDAVDIADLRSATVANLVATLQRHGRNHLLVVEGGGGMPARVRGLISRAQVERQLGSPIPVTEVANAFPDVVRMLA
jgi:CBS domain-containing protein